MKKILFILPLLCLSLHFSYAQNKNTIWCFGDSAGIDFFNIQNPSAINSAIRSRGSCASISDSLNNLVFYSGTFYLPLWQTGFTDLTVIYDSSNNVMLYGDSIIGEGWYKENLILPKLNSANEYYLFSIGVGGANPLGLYYSIVDKSQNNNLGAVIIKNIQLQPYKASDGLAAIKHGNGRDWWLFFKRWDIPNNSFFVYLITPDSVTLQSTQQIGAVATNAGFYRIEPSWDGSKLACVTTQGIIEVFDFDRCTGIISNTITIDTEQPSGNPIPWYWSCELSIDKSKLYVMSILQGSQSDSAFLIQFDMNASNIFLSADTIYSFIKPTAPGALELAPNGKIYLSCAYENPGFPYPDSVYNMYNMNLSVINSPDSLGSACNFQPFSFYLGGNRTYYGLPNNPNYELGAWFGSSCDTLGVGVEELTIKSEAELSVTYISEWHKLFVNAKNLQGKNCWLQIFDVNGRILFSSEKKTQSPYYTMDVNCSAFSKGMYIVHLQTEKEILTQKFIKD